MEVKEKMMAYEAFWVSFSIFDNKVNHMFERTDNSAQ